MVDEVVVGATRKQLTLTLVDEDDVPINLSGAGVSVRLQGKCADLPAKTIDAVGALLDPPNGVCQWSSLGTLVSAADLTSVEPDLLSALFNLRVKFTDSSGKIDWGPKFQIAWVVTPI